VVDGRTPHEQAQMRFFLITEANDNKKLVAGHV
jgi:hypothetical protein